ncbi:hypothetical protein [Allokutzneria albata]|uniref:hypothetical protein n=1 Tax=Allokutzneria albata TaxID=211114 RepID=UPI0012DCCFE1|nr:hypothetical protein [Allokutzneria albata]
MGRVRTRWLGFGDTRRVEYLWDGALPTPDSQTASKPAPLTWSAEKFQPGTVE